MKVAFSTLGCRVNQYETEAMSEKFIKQGYDIVQFNELADVYVINTCTVTNMGDRKSRQMISRARRENENAIIAVVGCYSQIAPEEVSSIEGVDVVLGTRNKGDVVYWVHRAMEEKEKIIEVKDVLKNKTFEELNIEEYQDRTRAFLKVQDGCNRFCSYCLIPFARGAVCSKDPSKVIEEVRKLANHGFKEIILSGIDIASYGVDLNENWDLLLLLKELDKIEGVTRIRIGSIDPTFFKDNIIEGIGKLKKLCPHFHLSLQSGCNETLKRMNRKYTVEQYKYIVSSLRERIKGVSITTDIIVGFPGETEEEFEKTYNFLSDIKLSKMHVFKFSPRKGTRAAKMDNQIDGKIKEKRSSKLIKLDKIQEKEFINKFIGQSMSVLYEKLSKQDGYYEGYTPNYIKVLSNCENDISGNIVETCIEKSDQEFAYGKI
ncbi:tRNA (N(6)-L-threonylcarbamoyladenosine(37)-C(2))-methylthiotransferase MtaB [Clostridium oceanicum]|uniref:tRNA (N(6)-L-threonylcarbamoyladenosine(37)-C(2))-methylthiotransferase n=1 Tax=Clostridium oceanicum TaxID=1543 RepID=A0ABP3V617_9CLOT